MYGKTQACFRYPVAQAALKCHTPKSYTSQEAATQLAYNRQSCKLMRFAHPLKRAHCQDLVLSRSQPPRTGNHVQR